MKTAFAIISAVVLLPWLTSCGLFSEGDVGGVKPEPPLTEQMRQRAASFRDALEGVTERAVFIAEDELDFYEELPEIAAARLTLLGINQVYFNVGLKPLRPGIESRKLRRLVGVLKRNNIESALVIRENELLPLFGRTPIAAAAMRDIVNTIVRYNNSAAVGERFNLLVIEFMPHRINARMSNPPEGLLFSWGDDSFGPSRDNDMLTRHAVSVIEYIRDKLPKLRLRISAEYFFHELRSAEKIHFGSADDFLKHSEAVIIATHQNTSAATFDAVRNELADAGTANSIVVKVMTSRRLFGVAEEKSWSRDHWDSLLAKTVELTAVCKKYSTWRGIVFDSLGGLERCWER